MRTYEIAYIADPDLDDEALTALEERVQGWVVAAEGKIVKTDRWGKRKLAYPIQKKTEGYYYFIQSEIPSQAGSSIEQNLNLNEQVLRFMITRHEEA